jgi:PilZ domain-containing protein
MPKSSRSVETRRSERVLLTIAIHVRGKDSKGDDFIEHTSTVVVGRNGALICSKRDLVPESTIKVVNPRNNRSAEFRVVMRHGTPQGEQAHWGVECLDATQNIWGIDFPAPLDPDNSDARALLRCDRCAAFVFTNLARVAYDVLDVPGAVHRFCNTCQTTTPWTLSEYRSSEVAKGDVEPVTQVADSKTEKLPVSRAARVPVKMRLRVRDPRGRTEFTRAENISKTGLCFTSERDYSIDEMLMVAMGYTEGAHNIEALSRVVRKQSMPDSPRKLYGLRFER